MLELVDKRSRVLSALGWNVCLNRIDKGHQVAGVEEQECLSRGATRLSYILCRAR